MKRIYKYILLLAIACFSSCVDTPVSDDYKATMESHYLDISESSIHFDSKESSKGVRVTSSQSWFFSEYASWIDLSQNKGSGCDYITLKVAKNESGDNSRTSIFYLNTLDEDWNFTKPLSVDQSAATPYINISSTELILSGAASTQRIIISSNIKWEAECDQEWISLIVADDSSYIDISCTENHNYTSRTGSLLIQGATSKSVSILQNAATLSTEINSLDFSQAGGSYLLSMSSEVSWHIETSHDWIEASPSQGNAGNTEISISTLPNWSTDKRSGKVNFYIGKSKVAYVNINQGGVSLSASKRTLSFKALGESKSVKIYSNIAWEVLSKPSWIDINTTSASGDISISVTAKNNSDSIKRSDVIYIGKEGVTHTAKITVSQEGKYFSVNNELLDIESKGGSMEAYLSTNDNWSVNLQNNATWLSISEKDGKESKSILFTANDNPSVNPRSETAIISPQDMENVNIVIRQRARYLSIDHNGVDFFSKGGTSAPIIVDTDGQFEITEHEDWISVIVNENVFYVNADINKTGHTRKGYITIALTDLKEGSMSLKVEVTQWAPGGNFQKEDYSEDQLWNASLGEEFSLIVVGYAEDDTWDEVGNQKVDFIVEGYQEDNEWNQQQGTGSADKEDFPKDDNNDDNKGSGDADKEDYPEDDNNDDNEGSGDASKEDYPEDDNNDDNEGSGDADKEDYPEDDNNDDNEGSGDADKKDYPEDDNNDDNEGSGDTDKEDYPEDDNNDDNEGSGDLSKDDYTSDENYDNDNI